MGGAEAVLVQAEGHEADAAPDGVQMNVAGLGDVCAIVLAAPHPLRSTKAKIATGAPARKRVMLFERWCLQMITKRHRLQVRPQGLA
jgi:hypothetical protein